MSVEPKDLAFEAAHLLDDKKATDIIVVDVSEVADITDYFVIATAGNRRLVDSLVDDLEERLKTLGAEPISIEGREECTWALVDYGPVIVHIFQPEARDYYRLEHLWRRARFYDMLEGELVERLKAASEEASPKEEAIAE